MLGQPYRFPETAAVQVRYPDDRRLLLPPSTAPAIRTARMVSAPGTSRGTMASVDAPNRALVTQAAVDLLSRLQDRHGALMFHQSGGCCDGSSPMCYPDGDFIVGDRDVLLSVLNVGAGVPVWISGSQFDTWKHTQLVIDVVPGRGGGFSLEAPEGMRFLSRGRAFTDDENRALTALLR